MEPSSAILAAAVVWLDLLSRNSFSQAQALVGNTPPSVGGFTQAQYSRSLSWLQSAGLLQKSSAGWAVNRQVLGSTMRELACAVLETAIQRTSPAWLLNADEVVRNPDDLPVDVGEAADALGISTQDAYLAVRRAHQKQQKFDAERLAAIGAVGESAVLRILEEHWPGAAHHVSTYDDSAGYDISLGVRGEVTHIEVKTTTSRAKLALYLSRNEFETCKFDGAWRLVVVGFDEPNGRLVFATLRDTRLLIESAPRDGLGGGTWQTARFQLSASALVSGIRLNGLPPVSDHSPRHGFEWLPRAEQRS